MEGKQLFLTPEQVTEIVTSALYEIRGAWIAAHNSAVNDAIDEAVSAVVLEYDPMLAGKNAEIQSLKDQAPIDLQNATAAVVASYAPRLAGLRSELNTCYSNRLIGEIKAGVIGAGLTFIVDQFGILPDLRP